MFGFKRCTLIKLVVLTLLLSACGGGGSGDPGEEESEVVLKGRFIDSAVANIKYRTASEVGYTNSLGEFTYREGESIVFSIGGLDLPSAKANSLVTPLDLVNTNDAQHPAVINIARLLQTLDSDGNPGNGIRIHNKAHETAQRISVDFEHPNFDSLVTNLVANSGSIITSLVDEESALNHLTSSLALVEDTDNDGVLDNDDNCVSQVNANQVDTDVDGQGDACDATPNGPDGVEPSIMDFDGDSFTPAEGDCNDGNAAINPSAVDVPNNSIDEDCSGADAVDLSILDGDGDSFTPADGDCNDGNAAINPSAVDVPNNSIDEDCSGADAVDLSMLDSDGDSYTPAAGDCNDTDSSIFPGATDSLGNDIDENCDGVDGSDTPHLISISPVANAVGIDPNEKVLLTFSEPMNQYTVNSKSIALYANGGVIPASVFLSADGQEVSLTASMPSSSIVSIVLTDGPEDLSGNSLHPIVSSFTTAATDIDTDKVRPRVIQQIPVNGTGNLFDVNQVVLIMDEAMDASSIQTSFYVTADGERVEGTTEVLSDNQTIRFTADEDFTEGSYVQVFLESLASDDSGNAAFDYDGYFRMGSHDESVGSPAKPVEYSPYNNQRDVALNPLLMVRFNEVLDLTALSRDFIYLQKNGTDTKVGVNFDLDGSGHILKLTPDALLEPNTNYYLHLKNIVDNDGDINSGIYPPNFTTGVNAEEDDLQPFVLSMNPPNGALDVGFNGAYSVRFSERMNPVSFDRQNNQLVNVEFSEDNHVVRYRRQGILTPSTEVTETIPEILDLSGNKLVAFGSTFTTSTRPDFTAGIARASAVGTIPANARVFWMFDEPIDPVSVTEAGVYLHDNLMATKVETSLSLSANGRRLELVLLKPLALGLSYRYYVNNLRDLAGNSLLNRSSLFKTSFVADTTAPQTLTATISTGQTDVPLNARFNMRFDESLSYLMTPNISLVSSTGEEKNVSLSFNNDRTMLTIRPNQLLSSRSNYTLVVSGIEDRSGNVKTGTEIINFTTGNSADFRNGEVLTLGLPESRINKVALNPLLEVSFSERVDPTSITKDSFYLRETGENRRVSGSWTLGATGTVLTFIPDNQLEPFHVYELSFSYGQPLKDLSGNSLTYSEDISFSTGGSVDEQSPAITLLSVMEGSRNVPVNGRVILEMDEPISGGCSPEAILASSNGELALNVSMSFDRLTLNLTPREDLLANTNYRLSLSNLCDYSGNALTESRVLNFTTSADEADTRAPALVSITPIDNALNVAVDTSIVMEFDEAIDLTSRPKVSLHNLSLEVAGSYVVSGNTVTFTPDSVLQGDSQYRVDLHRSVEDLAGNTRSIGSHYFTTEATADSDAPRLVAISPVADAVGISPEATVHLSFSEPMSSFTVGSNNIALYSNGEVVRSNLYRSSDGKQVSLTANLPPSSVVSVILTDGLEDLSGNPLPSIISSFTTGAIDSDSVRPKVIQQIPVSGSDNLFNLDQVVLVLNDSMDASSILSSFHLVANGVRVEGKTELLNDNQTIRFSADETFEEGAYVQVFLESLATDTSGNAVYEYDGYFKMGSSNELVGTAAKPVVYSPYGYQKNVTLNPDVMVRFNEPLDPTKLNEAVIELAQTTGNVIVGVDFELDDSGYVLRILPNTLLKADTTYSLSLGYLVDSDGDMRPVTHFSFFTTGTEAIKDDRQPTVLMTSPPNGATGIAINSSYSVRFDEPMNPLSIDYQNAPLSNVRFSEDNRVVRYDRHGILDASAVVTESVPLMSDLSGNQVIVVNSTFTTSTVPDVTPPVAVGSTSGTVGSNSVLYWKFDEPIDPVSISSSSVSLFDKLLNRAVETSLGLSADGMRVDITPTEPLALGRDYVYYADSLRDLSGNTASYSETFSTLFNIDDTPPQVLNSTVSDAQIDVPINARFNVRFDEPLNELVTSGISLKNSSDDEQSISISFNSDRTIVTILAQQLLSFEADYTLTLSGMKDISGNAQSVPFSANFTTSQSADLKPRSDVAWSIKNGSVDVSLNPVLEVTLSERIDPTSIDERSFYLSNEHRRVSGDWSLNESGTGLRFIPADNLEPGHLYYLILNKGTNLKDLSGHEIGSYEYISFTTGNNVDVLAPAIALANIGEGSIDVPINGRFIVTLDEPLGRCSPEAVLTSSEGDVTLSVSTSSSLDRLTLTSPEKLMPSTSYALSLFNVCDYSGNKLNDSNVISFTTSDRDEDTRAPSLVKITPTDNAIGVAVSTSVVMTFDEPVDQTVRPLIKAGSLRVLGDYHVSGDTITFTPDAKLQADTQYQVDLNNGVPDLAGNISPIGYRYFTTQSLEDTEPPRLSAISPVASAIAINPDVTIHITFSEPMNPGTLNTNNIALYANGEIIKPWVYRSTNGQQASLTASIPSSSVVSVILTDGLEDLSGNKLSPVASSFTTTVIDSDIYGPRVLQQVPVNGSTNRSDLDQIVLLTNRRLDVSSIQSALHVVADGVLVTGMIEVLSGKQAIRFTADESFAEGAYVQVFLQSSAKDELGNAAYEYDGYFHMASSEDLIGEQAEPDAYSPYNNQLEVTLNPQIMVRYNEPLDPTALNDALIDLQVDATDESVSLDLSLDSSGYVLQIAPRTLLDPSTTYELRLYNIVDSDGDINTMFYTPEFTTGTKAVEDDRRPIVLAMSPTNGATDVGFNGNYSVRFDERMNPVSLDPFNNQITNVQFSEDNRVVRYNRPGILDPITQVIETVPTISDLSGNNVVSTSNTFTTSAKPDFASPVGEGSINGLVSLNPVIAWEFNEPIDPVSVSSTGVFLRDATNGQNIPITFGLSAENKRLDIVPSQALEANNRYFYYGYSLRDLSGNSAGNMYEAFTTSHEIDSVAPEVVDTTVYGGQTDVPTNTRFKVRVNEPLSILASLEVSLRRGGVEQAIDVSFNSDRTVMTVTPTQLLLGGSIYTLGVSGMEDLSGNIQSIPLSLDFTTGKTADLKTSGIHSWSIQNNATEVALDEIIDITFYEPVDPTSIGDNFYLRNLTDKEIVPSDWVLSDDRLSLMLQPESSLETNKSYRFYAGYNPNFEDLAGNRVGNDSYITFSTTGQ